MDNRVLDQFIRNFIKASVSNVVLLDKKTIEELVRLATEEAKKHKITE